jgi:hypothetical protein
MPHASKTPAEAVEHYRGRTVRLLSCVSSVHVVVRAYHLSDTPHGLELADTAKMHGGPLSIDVAEEYEVRQDTDGWRTEIRGYLYAIGYEGRELVSYHWHPSGNSPIIRPHMQLASISRSVIGGWQRSTYPPARSASSKSSRWRSSSLTLSRCATIGSG